MAREYQACPVEKYHRSSQIQGVTSLVFSRSLGKFKFTFHMFVQDCVSCAIKHLSGYSNKIWNSWMSIAKSAGSTKICLNGRLYNGLRISNQFCWKQKYFGYLLEESKQHAYSLCNNHNSDSHKSFSIKIIVILKI